MVSPKHIIISRTDSIGDVVLTLPVAGMIKKHFPECKVSFMGASYTEAVIAGCIYVDEFINWTSLSSKTLKEQIKFLKDLNADTFLHVFPKSEIARLAKRAGIPNRIGTNRRLFHWITCNHLVNLTRKNTNFHESQLNLMLLKALGIDESVSPVEMYRLTGFSKIVKSAKLEDLLREPRRRVILHPKSKGSAREWGTDNFARLIELLPREKYAIYISGTEEEGKLVRDTLVNPYKDRVTDLTGKLTLSEFIYFISESYGLVAASTGPLHIAAVLGKRAIGLYAPMRPIFPTRWAPVGPGARALVVNKDCSDCRKNQQCSCIKQLQAMHVFQVLNEEE